MEVASTEEYGDMVLDIDAIQLLLRFSCQHVSRLRTIPGRR